MSCIDDNPCTEDSCDTDGNCLHIALEGNPCHDGDGNPCTEGVCDGNGHCVPIALEEVSCNDGDGNPCTEGVCDASGNCVVTNLPDGVSCDDGLFCNGTDICIDGICTHSGDPCLPGQICDEATDFCANCDPEELGKLLASDGLPSDWFGSSVAFSGETFVIGARGDDDVGDGSGSAYVFTREASGSWTQQSKLTASDAAAYDQFGCSVAISEDTAVIGANADDNGSWSGSAYVFVRSNGTWTQQAKLTAANAVGESRFGYSVAVGDDTAVIGADKDGTPDTSDCGSAYVFTRDPSNVWTQQEKLTASDAAESGRFGGSVAFDGDTAVIGAQEDNHGRGAAYVFVRSDGVWTEQAKLVASDSTASDNFGSSVAFSGETAVIGAGRKSYWRGAAYVFVRSNGVWTEQAKLVASDEAAGAYFGFSVAVRGNMAVIGTWGDDHAGLNSGSAFVFARNSSGSWTPQANLIAWDGAEGDWFGSSVAISGDTAVIGASMDDDSGQDSGAAYVFDLSSCQGVCEHGPVLVDQPNGQAVCEGETVVFEADATGTDPLSYQWQRDGEPILGATADRYTINAADPADAGDYTVVVSDDCGSVTSDAATLTVYALPQPVIIATPAATVCGPTKITLDAGPGLCQLSLVTRRSYQPDHHGLGCWALCR